MGFLSQPSSLRSPRPTPLKGMGFFDVPRPGVEAARRVGHGVGREALIARRVADRLRIQREIQEILREKSPYQVTEEQMYDTLTFPAGDRAQELYPFHPSYAPVKGLGNGTGTGTGTGNGNGTGNGTGNGNGNGNGAPVEDETQKLVKTGLLIGGLYLGYKYLSKKK